MRGPLIAAALLLPNALAAQSDDVTVAMRTFNAVSVLSPPPWLDASMQQNIVQHTESSRQQGETPGGSDVFIMEWIPKGKPSKPGAGFMP